MRDAKGRFAPRPVPPRTLPGEEGAAELVSSYRGMGVEYIQWKTLYGTGLLDERVRSSHHALNGEVVRVGERFSNGLLFPGDFSVYMPHETENCRCRPVPFYLPEGYAPAAKSFFPHEILKVGD
ncbi:MAG: hypothetical protein M3P49_12810 [Actinomycetota bacterium]|nr:hypothetical protein [Actinomycetota bacterium]